jgi:hypothetical protein
MDHLRKTLRMVHRRDTENAERKVIIFFSAFSASLRCTLPVTSG